MIDQPSIAHQQDALQKGLGRAHIWAGRGTLEEKALLNACLNDLRFDAQVDDVRGLWLWRLICSVGAAESFREPILEALVSLSEEGDADQLCEIGYFFAREGDARFHKRLCAIVESKPIPARPWLGEMELVRLDGERGFLRAVRVRGESLRTREWDWDDRYLFGLASETLGEGKLSKVLAFRALEEPAVDRFLRMLQIDRQNSEQRRAYSHRDRMREFSANDILSAAESVQSSFTNWRGWGMYASEEDLQIVLDRLLTSSDVATICNYLKVFSNRPLPRFDERLLDFCLHPDEHVSRRAFAAIAKNTHPSIRLFAVTTMLQGRTDAQILSLFIRNFERGDERLLEHHLRLNEDPCELHWQLMELSKILEENSGTAGNCLMLMVYEKTPCASCRERSVRWLISKEVAPDWLLDECRYDVDDETRTLAGEPNWLP